MKVIIVTSYLTSKGGVARYVSGFSEYLSKLGDSVILASLYSDSILYKSKENIKVVDLADESCLPQSIRFWASLGDIRKKFSHLVIKEKPDVILFNDFPATLWAQKYNHIPVLCYTHDIHMLYTDTYINNLPNLTRLFWRFLRVFVREYDKKKWNCFNEVVCNSNFMAKYILKTYKKNTKVIYVGTDTNIFSPSEGVTKKRAILTIGDLKVRRVDFLIKAAQKIFQKRTDFEIWIVGNKGEDDKRLKELVKTNGLEGMVKFFGTINDDSKLAIIYSESLVLVHLVKESAFGLTAGEAMACETPVIAWKPSGLEELIEDGITGYNIEENNEEILIKRIEEFLDNPAMSTEMGKKARKRVQNFVERNDKFQELRELMERCIPKI